jgi:hypothetical protein
MHHHAEHPWRVRVDGQRRGAGILLDERHVLTCAHVVGDEGVRVTVRSAVCRPAWSVAGGVVPGSWVYPGGQTRRGDVALLVLDEAVPCDARARLWCAPISGGKVRAHGFPRTAPYGISANAELGGDGGRGGELGLLNRVDADGPWIEPGYSGAGVMMLDGDHAEHVIGIVVADYVVADDLVTPADRGVRAAWMMPTETIRHYLPSVAPYLAGESATRFGPSGGLPELARDDTLRVALTQELARLLGGGWAGTVVLPGGGTGTSWLIRLVRTADPATRATVSDAEITGAVRDTVLSLGAVDAAYDAHGASLAEIRRYLADRFGFGDGEADLVSRLRERRPPVCLVVVGVDRAESPEALKRELLRPLAVSARSRGIRLVLGFDGAPPTDLPYEVSLDPAPVVRSLARGVDGVVGGVGVDVEARLGKLGVAEEAVARLGSDNELRFRKPPRPPRAHAPRLRVRFAVARAAGSNAELAAIDGEIAAALDEIAAFEERSRRLDERLADLRHTLEVNRVRAARHFGAEDRRLGDLHDQASHALWQAPIDLRAAGALLDGYVVEIDRRIDESE